MHAPEIDLASNPPQELPLRLAELHRRLPVGSAVRLLLAPRPAGPTDVVMPADLAVGAGFGDVVATSNRDAEVVDAVRLRSLPDVVGPGMVVLVCGLNPSLHAADAGVGYAGPANRFWPVVADVVGLAERDPKRLLRDHAIGMTDLVKRATPTAAAITRDEFRAGLARVERLTAWLQPGAVCLVGLSGWRAAGRPRARTGRQPEGLAGRPVYVMPSTSGRNAHATRAILAEHLRLALEAGATRSSGCCPA